MRKKLFLTLLTAASMFAFGQNKSMTGYKNVSSTGKIKTQKGVSKAAVLAQASSLAKAPAAYCIPVDMDCTDGDLLTNVTFGTINNTSTCGANGYNDFTSMATEITPGSTMNISVAVGSGWYEKVSVWADWNNNETFEASELLSDPTGGIGGGGTGITLNADLSIPAGLASGSYRMRVLLAATGSGNPAPSDACLDAIYGEVEDYTLTVPASGCLTAGYGQYPSATYTPGCTGSTEVITSFGYTGEYSKVNVVGGTQYTFSSDDATVFITIGDEAGATVLASGTGSVVYTPAADAVVRFYTHLDASCGEDNAFINRQVMCGTPPVEPDYGCDQTYDGVWDYANSIAKHLGYGVANDFFVPMEAGTYTLNEISFYVVGLADSDTDFSNFDVTIMNDNAGAPGTAVATLTAVVPTSVVQEADTFAGYNTYTITLDMADTPLPVNAAADTRYWVGIQGTSASSQNMFWIAYPHTVGWVTAPAYQSTNGTWAEIANDGAPYEGVWSVDGNCLTQGVSDVNSRAITYYPNPVKDLLSITSSKKIENVEVYSIAGQVMMKNAKLADGKLNMSRLAPGTYLVRVTTADGVTENFKIIKN